MTTTGLLGRGREWVSRAFGSGRPQPPEPAEPIESLRQRVARALIGVDDAIRASQEELDLARCQLGAASSRRFVTALESARALDVAAFARHAEATELARGASAGGPEERTALTGVLELTQEADAVLEGEAEEFTRLRDLRARVPGMLDELLSRAEELETDLPGAQELLGSLRAEYGEEALTSVTDSTRRAGRLVHAARGLIASGHAHLEDGDDRAAAVASARGAEEALGQARDELREVEQAGESLATADEDVRQALNSIHEDLSDVRRLRADDTLTTAAVEHARAVIDAANTARREGGDLLSALADLEVAERDIDDALVEYREAAEHRRRAQVRLERRVRNVSTYIAGVDRRASRLRGGMDARTRSQIARAERLLTQAKESLPRDPVATAGRLDEAMAAARTAQDGVDDAVMSAAAIDYRAHGDGVLGGEDLLALALGGIAGAIGSSGGGWGGSSGGGGGGFGGGGRF